MSYLACRVPSNGTLPPGFPHKEIDAPFNSPLVLSLKVPGK